MQLALHEGDAGLCYQHVDLYEVVVVTIVQARVGAGQVVRLRGHKADSYLQQLKRASV